MNSLNSSSLWCQTSFESRFCKALLRRRRLPIWIERVSRHVECGCGNAHVKPIPQLWKNGFRSTDDSDRLMSGAAMENCEWIKDRIWIGKKKYSKYCSDCGTPRFRITQWNVASARIWNREPVGDTS